MSMETGTWFKIFLFLVVVGTVVSLMPGSTTPMPVFNATLNLTALNEAPVICSSWVPLWCGITDWGSALYNFIFNALTFIWQGMVFFGSAVLFFTGITSIFSGALIPAPLNIIVGLVVIFMWLFIALDMASRIVGVIWGR